MAKHLGDSLSWSRVLSCGNHRFLTKPVLQSGAQFARAPGKFGLQIQKKECNLKEMSAKAS